MGAWGTGPFDNDDAADWVFELEGSADGTVIRRALDISATDYLDVYQGTIAVAAAEVVAAAVGAGGPELPEDVAAWLEQHSNVLAPSDAQLAIVAVQRTMSADSEASELWDETGDDSWILSLQDLLRRLQNAL